MTERDLLPGEYAVLALLTLRPMHGYDMARYFADELGEVLPVEQSLLYAYVRNVEKRGLIQWAEERVGNRPPRKVYYLTEEGEQTAWSWLRRPVTRMREIRVELLVKLFVLHQAHPLLEQQLVQEQLAACERYLERAAERAGQATGFAALVADSKRSAAEATLAWLRNYARTIEAA